MIYRSDIPTMIAPTKPPRSEALTDVAALDGVEEGLEELEVLEEGLEAEPVEDEAGPVVVREEA